ncbi:MAG: radical SAM protein [Planctomycetota bacterium]
MSDKRHNYLLFELTKACQNRCVFCYNVWKEDHAYPKEELTATEAMKLMDRVIPESGCRFMGLTGGEPLLKEGFFEIVSHIASKGVTPVLISNGKLLTEDNVARCMESGIEYFEVSLHGHKPGVHDELVRRSGSFEEAIEAVLQIKKRGGQVNTVFVATKKNISRFKEYVELNALLRTDWILFNRVACGGEGIDLWASLAPSPADLRGAFEVGAALAEKYRIGLSAGVQIQPCLVDLSRYPHIKTSFCPLNGELDGNAYFAIDPAGNLRMCNRSKQILGSLRKRPFWDLVESAAVKAFCRAVPEFCRDCGLARVCAGGCKADALSCHGTLKRPDPYLELWKEEVRKTGTGTAASRKAE